MYAESNVIFEHCVYLHTRFQSTIERSAYLSHSSYYCFSNIAHGWREMSCNLLTWFLPLPQNLSKHKIIARWQMLGCICFRPIAKYQGWEQLVTHSRAIRGSQYCKLGMLSEGRNGYFPQFNCAFPIVHFGLNCALAIVHFGASYCVWFDTLALCLAWIHGWHWNVSNSILYCSPTSGHNGHGANYHLIESFL